MLNEPLYSPTRTIAHTDPQRHTPDHAGHDTSGNSATDTGAIPSPTPASAHDLDVIRKASPEALDLAYHTIVTCEVCKAAEAETPPCLAKFCLKGQSLFLNALRAEADRRKVARAAAGQASR